MSSAKGEFGAHSVNVSAHHAASNPWLDHADGIRGERWPFTPIDLSANVISAAALCQTCHFRLRWYHAATNQQKAPDNEPKSNPHGDAVDRQLDDTSLSSRPPLPWPGRMLRRRLRRRNSRHHRRNKERFGCRRCHQRLTSGPTPRKQLLRGQGISPGHRAHGLADS